GLAEISRRIDELEGLVAGLLWEALKEQLERIEQLDEQIDTLERRIGSWQKQEAAGQAVAGIPGIGKLTATALVATMGDAKAFKSGREFAAYIGLVPAQSGTGGKVKL